MSDRPRPYVVLFKLPSGETASERVSAYELMEALTQATARVLGKGYVDPKVIDCGPDIDALKAASDIERKAAAVDWITECIGQNARVLDKFKP